MDLLNYIDRKYMKLVQRLSFNLLLAIIIAASIIAIDLMYKSVNEYLAKSSHLHQTEILLLLGMSLSFLPKTRNAISLYLLLIFLLFIQLVHYSYFGTRISPIEISLFFTHSSETIVSLDQIWHITLLPLALCVIASLITTAAFLSLKNRLRWRFAWVFILILFFIPLFSPFKRWIHHKPVKNPMETNLNHANGNDDLLYAMHKSIVYYLVYTLPDEFKGNRAALPQKIKPAFAIKNANPDVNIVFIQGESLTRSHMSAYGYSRPTTPFLDSLKQSKNVIFKKGISAGVCTDISLPLFFNMVMQPDGTQQINSTNRNLFKMAEQNGFVTHFISTHCFKNFGFIQELLFPGYIDHYQIKGKTNHFAPDTDLINYVKNVNFEKPTFLVLQPGGSHSPYEWRYPANYNYFTEPTENNSFRQQQINLYDNSVRYTDHIIHKIVTLVQQKTKRPTYIIFTSDHGESLGEQGVYGHNNVYMQAQHQVPIIIIALNGASLDFLQNKQQVDVNNSFMSHYELSKIIAKLLGFNVKQLSEQKYGYWVTGVVLDGSGGYDHLTFDNKGVLRNHFNETGY